LDPQHTLVLKKWLARHPDYRLASEADCNCPEDIEQMRRGYGGVWVPVPDYHPYRAVGDFNSDGNLDFAVVLVKKTNKEKPFALVIFNGPFRSDCNADAAFIERNLDLKYSGLFFGPPRPKPYRLVVGRFESEGALLEPHGATYKWLSEIY
jgi:hypothetical protein